MKTNYYALNNENMEATIKALCADATAELAGKKVKVGFRNDCEITEVSNLLNNPSKQLDMLMTITFGDGSTKKLCYLTAIANKFLSVDDETSEIIDYILAEIAALDEINKENEHAAFLAKQQEFEEQKKAKKLEEHNKRMAAKRKSQVESAMRSVNRLKPMSPNDVDEFYVCLGWVAKHVKNIEARLPDFLDNWFVKEFGDVERHISDSTKLTTGGFISQWALSIKIILDTNEGMPAALTEMLGEESKKTRPISRTDYAFTLCKQYGFKFGKKQDIDEILKTIPSDKVESFEFGYGL